MGLGIQLEVMGRDVFLVETLSLLVGGFTSAFPNVSLRALS